MVYVQKRTFTQCLKEANLTILAVWMRLKDAMLSETSQSKRLTTAWFTCIRCYGLEVVCPLRVYVLEAWYPVWQYWELE